MTDKPDNMVDIMRDMMAAKIKLDLRIGELLRTAKKQCDAGREPDAELAPAINELFKHSKVLAKDLGEGFLIGGSMIAKQALGKNYDEGLVQSYINYHLDPSQDNFDKILDAFMAAVGIRGHKAGRYGHGLH